MNCSEIFQKTKVILASLLCFSVALEVAARIDDKINYDAPLLELYSPHHLKRKDKNNISYNVPNSHFEKWKINSSGFRGPEILPSEAGKLRIVCMGTSETYGIYESPEHEWPAQFRKILENNHNFEIINASVVGLALDKFIPYIDKYVMPTKPDIFILVLNPFRYGFNNKDLQQDNAEQRQKARKNGFSPKKILKVVLENIRVLRKIKLVVKNILPESVIEKKRLWMLNRQIKNLKKNRLKNNEQIDIIPQESIATFRDDVEQLIDFLSEKGIDVILCSYPSLISKENIDKHKTTFLDHQRFYIGLSIKGILDAAEKFNAEIIKIAEKNKLDCLDINTLIPKTKIFFADNVHYTDKGADIFAKSINEFVHNKKEFCKNRQSFYTAPHPMHTKHNEILKPR